MNIGDTILRAKDHIIPYHFDLIKSENKYLGNWLGAYWISCAEGDYSEIKKSSFFCQYGKFLSQVVPNMNRKQFYFPERPQWIGELKTKDYFRENLETGIYNTIWQSFIPHSIASFCNFMYDNIYGYWLNNDKSPHYNPIGYVGNWLKSNQIEFVDNFSYYKEFMKEINGN